VAEDPTDEWWKACFSLLRNSFQIQADENATNRRMVPAASRSSLPPCHEVLHPTTLRAGRRRALSVAMALMARVGAGFRKRPPIRAG